ncbi:MAG: calcium/sodium antiporter [Candidatus Marinimicrobia bacterium]|nr:calcium/sodium antiporter [Candidatus Neomarinimicrobiota bacterium]
MILNSMLLIVGAVCIYIGAEGLVWGGSRLASHLRVAPIVIGLSVVAFGTSMPEFSVSLYSVLHDVPDIAVGNIIGSNIANVALILAASAVIFPVAANYSRLRNDILIVIGVTVLFIGLTLDGELNRSDGIILLAGILLYIYRLIKTPLLSPESITVLPGKRPVHFILALLLGLVVLLIGTQIFTNSAVTIARFFDVPELVIGATIVAIGTSIPELATSMIAAFRKHSGIVLGNILGSNVFNLMAVMGIVPLVRPIQIPANAVLIQMPLMLALTIILLPMIRFQGGVRRSAGIILLGVYAVFTVYMYRWGGR